MEIRLHDPDPPGLAAFARLAAPVLEADPVRHTVVLSVLHGLRLGVQRAAVLLTAHDGERTVGAALGTPNRPVLVSALPPACAPAAEAALPGIAGVGGPLAEVEAYAAARTARTGSDVVIIEVELRLFALATLVPPAGVAGEARAAVRAESDLLAAWREAFVRDTEAAPAGHRTGEEETERAFATGRDQVLWCVDGDPRALAVAGPAGPGAVRIGPVYTPPGYRGHGYASAATAAAAFRARAAGARHVVLFTDLANPTTNHIYPEIGFRPVYDAREVRFG